MNFSISTIFVDRIIVVVHFIISNVVNIIHTTNQHRRKSRGNESPEFGLGDANANFPSRICQVSKFQAPDCLQYNVSRDHGQKIPLRIHKNTSFQAKNSNFFWGEGLVLSQIPHQWEGYCLPTRHPLPRPSLLDPPLRPTRIPAYSTLLSVSGKCIIVVGS